MSSTPASKRQNSWSGSGSGRKKSKKAKKKASHTGAILRVCCPVKYVGNVIGKGGLVISQIRQQTGAIIKVEDAVVGCLERIILFVGCEDQSEFTVIKKELKKEEADENGNEEVEEEDEDDVKDSSVKEDLCGDGNVERSVSSAQMALLKTFDRMVEGEKEVMNCDDWGDKPVTTSIKLVVFASQGDFLKRIDGGIFSEISSESGAKICFLRNDEHPSCVSNSDELLQIAGGVDEIKKALVSITHQLLENPPQTSELSKQKIPKHPSFSAAQTQTPNESSSDRIRNSAVANHQISNMSNGIIKMSFRLMCPEIKAGAVIGRGGSVVKGLQQDTGCEIDIADRQVDADERIILISGPAHPDDRISPIQDGVLRVHDRIIKSPPESKKSNVTARLLVPSSQTSTLLGKGGVLLAEIRRLSRAQVHVLGKEHLPKRVSLNDDLVQVTGDFESVQEALLHITGQLQSQFFHTNLEIRGPFQGGLPPPPHGAIYNNDEPSLFMHNIQRLGVPLHILERNSSPVPWRPEGLVNGALRMGSGYVEDPLRRLPGGIHPAVITNTTLEVVVPSSVIPSIYGEGGGCLQQIRQISDATIVIADPKPGTAETVITISGTHEQTNAAQSLIQAFVICESQSL